MAVQHSSVRKSLLTLVFNNLEHAANVGIFLLSYAAIMPYFCCTFYQSLLKLIFKFIIFNMLVVN